MGLIKSVVLDSGLVTDNAYIRIENFYGRKQDVNLNISFYANKDAQRNGKPSIVQKNYSFTLDLSDGSANIIRQGYESLKANDPFFTDAEDDLDDTDTI